MSDEIKIEYRPLAELSRWPRNPKLHDLAALRASMVRFGFVLPLVVDEQTDRLVAGHGRLECLMQMQQAGEQAPARIKQTAKGGWLVPVVTGVGFSSEQEAESYLLADNRLVELGGWDQAGLTQMLVDLQQAGAVQDIGWTDQEIVNMVAATAVKPVVEPQDVEFRAYDEGDAAKVKMVECPQCQHKFPL